jgi:RNA polymerase sigma-70 factor (ECF subfamily)
VGLSDQDEAEFRALFLGARSRLAAQLYALTGDPVEASEVVQEAFARAWERWLVVRSTDHPEAWVRKVAYRLAVSRWRRTRRVVSSGDLSGRDSVVAGPEPLPDLVTALRSLPPKQMRALVLHHMAGLSVEETAAEMSVPTGTVKSWLSRGRAHLADLLEPEAEGAGL